MKDCKYPDSSVILNPSNVEWEKGHGLFTYFLLKKLKETKGSVTYGELSDYLQTEVKCKSIVANSKSQTPAILSSASLGDTWKNMRLKLDV